MRVWSHVAEVGSAAKVIVQGFPTLPTYLLESGRKRYTPL